MTLRTKGLLKMLLVGAVVLAVGIIVMTHTSWFLKVVMIAAGISSFVEGLYTLFGVRKWCFTEFTRTFAIIKGVEATIIGIASVFVTIFAADTFLSVMVYIFAVGLIFSSVVSFENAFVAKRFGIPEMKSHFLIEGIVTLLVSLILFFRPIDTIVTVVKVLSIIFIILGSMVIVISIIALIRSKKQEA